MDTNLDEIDAISSGNEITNCKYYTSQEFLSAFESLASKTSNCNTLNSNDPFSILHINSRSINKKLTLWKTC